MASILLVEDNQDLRLVLKMAIESLGYEVESARDGQEALDLLGHSTPHVMICDMTMPLIDGATVIRHVRALERDYERMYMTIIAMSGTESDSEPAHNAGADYFFTKPFNVTDLDSLLKQIGLG